jgi:hypothetical protein
MNGNEIYSIRNLSGDFGAYVICMDNIGYIYIAGSQMASFCTIKINPGDIVPVDLISFTAEVIEHNILLVWSTASETNNMGFEIYKKKSKDRSQKSEWEKVGFVSGFGTSTEIKSYSFNDNKISLGTYSYRLKQINYDGSYEYSTEVEVSILIPVEFSLAQNYPNPFNPNTTISFSLPIDAKVTLKLFNSLGEFIEIISVEEFSAGNNSINFSAHNLVSGVYLYSINARGKDNSSYYSVKKMVVIK